MAVDRLRSGAADAVPAGTVASLIPSGTDILAALGLGGRLVGVSHECDHAIADGLPVLTASTLVEGMDPEAIDAAVSASVSDGGSLYRTDRQRLHDIAPDVVLSQDVCDVCAVNGEVARGDVPDGTELVMLTAVRLADLWDDVRRVGRATGAVDAAEHVVQAAQVALESVAAAVAGAGRRRVVVLDWGRPPFAGGHWVPDLVAVGGGDDVLATADPMSRRITWDAVVEAEPEVIVFLPCGYTLDQAVAEARTLPLPEVVAATRAEVWAVDATRLFSRCTPQAVVFGAQVVAAILHPAAMGAPAPVDAVRVHG
jgi:iron complex transport system substrate-binding protein